MKIVVKDVVSRGKYHEGWIVTKTSTVNPEVIAALCTAVTLVPGLLGKLAGLVKEVQISFHQAQTEFDVFEVIRATVVAGEVHEDLPGGWKTVIDFRPRSLVTEYGSKPTAERPLPYMKEHELLYGRVYPSGLVAERLARAIKEQVTASLQSVQEELAKINV